MGLFKVSCLLSVLFVVLEISSAQYFPPAPRSFDDVPPEDFSGFGRTVPGSYGRTVPGYGRTMARPFGRTMARPFGRSGYEYDENTRFFGRNRNNLFVKG